MRLFLIPWAFRIQFILKLESLQLRNFSLDCVKRCNTCIGFNGFLHYSIISFCTHVSIIFTGEGQLEISINDGDVPNAVQVLGGGKCLVTYTPDQALTHEIEVTFNGEQVPGSPFLCRVMDPKSSKSLSKSVDPDSLASVELEHLSLIPTGEPSQFTIRVAGGDDAELAVSVQGKSRDTLR